MARVLVIDDDSQMRDLLAETLTTSGHSVTLAADGKDGLRVFSPGSIDAVITDILMPQKEGLETIRELLLKQPGLKIVAVSGAPAPWRVLEIAQKFGALRVLAKPFTQEEILGALDDVLRTPPTAPQ